MNDRDDLEEILRTTYERRAQALEQQLDRRLSRLWRTERRPARWLLKPALALASFAVIFLGAWLYDLSQSRGAGPVVLDERFEQPQIVLRQPGDPVSLTQQLAGRQSSESTTRFVEPGPYTGVFRQQYDYGIKAAVTDKRGHRFWVEESGQLVRQTLMEDEIGEEIVLEGLDHPSSLAFDRDGSLLVLEGGTGHILRVEPIEGEIKAGSPLSVLAEGFEAVPRELAKDERVALKLQESKQVRAVSLAVSEQGEIFVGGQSSDGEAVVYKISRKSFKWWKFYCLYQC